MYKQFPEVKRNKRGGFKGRGGDRDRGDRRDYKKGGDKKHHQKKELQGMGFGKKPQFFKGDQPLVSRQDSSEFEVTVAKKAENDDERWADEDLEPEAKPEPKKPKHHQPKVQGKETEDGDRWKEEEDFTVEDLKPKQERKVLGQERRKDRKPEDDTPLTRNSGAAA